MMQPLSIFSKWTFLQWASESRESVRKESSINRMVRFWIVSGVAREYLEAPLHRWEPYSRQGRFGPFRIGEGARVWKTAWTWIRSLSSLLQISPQRKCVHSKTGQIRQRRPTWTGCHTFSGYSNSKRLNEYDNVSFIFLK